MKPKTAQTGKRLTLPLFGIALAFFVFVPATDSFAILLEAFL